MAIDVLKQLDERIQASVTRISQLRHENEKLAQQLTESEKRCAEANAQIKQLDGERRQHENERNEMRTRIEKILTRFDGLDLG
jgi:FtsZ-binding cell division protein ZapB